MASAGVPDVQTDRAQFHLCPSVDRPGMRQNRSYANIEAMRITIIALMAAMSASGQGPVRLRVDATDAPRRLFHVQMTMPAGIAGSQ